MENPVYVAKLKTDRGDALRIWEHDRWNGTVWQVDLHLRDASLWAHVRIINPTAAALKGYWWTNVQMPKTSGTSHTPEFINGQRCKPSDPTWPGSRVISPAWGTVTYSSHGLGLVDWPRFNEQCCGFGQSAVPGSMDGRGGGPIDMSWLSNYTGDNDAFLMCLGWNRTEVPFIVLADKDLWGDQHGVLHGHGTPFNKIWTMGMDDTHAWSETTHNWGGCFVELQIGVAPTQSHTFPLPAHSSHHHTEYWQLLDGLTDADRLYHPDYRVAVAAVADYVNGQHGVPAGVWRDMDAFAREVSLASLDALQGEVLFNGSAWGALDAALTGTPTPASVVYFEEPRTEFVHEDTAPWRELLHDGKFSNTTLEREPTTFVAGGQPQWLDKLVESAQAHGWTWLHHYHVALEAAERYDLDQARAHMNQSVAKRPSAVAYRGLAVMSDTPQERIRNFNRAWDVAATMPNSDPIKHAVAAEMAFSLRTFAANPATAPSHALEAWRVLQHRLEQDFTFTDLGSSTAGDELALSTAMTKTALGEPEAALQVMREHAFAHAQHGPRPALTGAWLAAQIAIEEAAKGRALTAVERKHVKYDPSRAPPLTMGAID